MKLAMTLIVRNEADIIEDNLRYHRAQGVDFFIVLDNGSTDGTVEILERYEQAGILTLVSMPGNDADDPAEGQHRDRPARARDGRRLGVPQRRGRVLVAGDDGNLKEAFERSPSTRGRAHPADGVPSAARWPRVVRGALTIRESRFRRPPKTAHRTHPSIKLWSAHPIDLWVKREAPPRSGLVGKPSLRIEATHKEEQELDLVLAPEFPIGALHFPLRSFEQYRKKIAIADHNQMWERNEETRALHEAYGPGRLEEVFENLLLDDEAVATGLRGGMAGRGHRPSRLSARLPGRARGGRGAPGASAWPAERREAALAELREDGMYVISRYMQTVASKKRKRHLQVRELKRLRARVKESRQELWAMERRSRRLERRSRRLEKVEKSRWWRMRPRLPARRRPGH